MKEGDVVVALLQQSRGPAKARPALLLKRMPPFQDCLLCGVSTQIHQLVQGFDELIEPTDSDYASSGLRAASIFRLGFLAVLPGNQIKGSVGRISAERLNRLRSNLANFLMS
jgi:mRNA interferase MazF